MSNEKIQIIEYIKNKGMVTASDISSIFSIGRSMVHRHLTSLVEQKILTKQGVPPKVYYSIATTQKINIISIDLDTNTEKIIEENFLLLTADGREILGVEGFIQWCSDRGYPIPLKATEYTKSLSEYTSFKKKGFIDATQKVIQTFKKETFLDSLYYIHPYSIPVFGKTKIAQWLFHAKQTQNKVLIKKVLSIVVPEIHEFIKNIRPSAIAFVPPTVPRGLQFMKELQKSLSVSIPILTIEKIKTPIMIQQKSLKDVIDRVQNAKNTMFIESDTNTYDTILVIDDFTGSGSTLNVIAEKYKNQKIGKEIIGLTITGSMNGFDVIKEI